MYISLRKEKIMITKLRNILVATLALGVIAAPVAAPVLVSAAGNTIQDCLSGGVGLSVGNGNACPQSPQGGNTGGTQKINDIITNVVNIFSAVVGVVSVIMIIFGGFKYISSGGDSGKVGEAKNTIVYAIIGLVVVALAQFIVQFVLNKVTNAQ